MNTPHSNVPRDPFHHGWTPAAAPAGAAMPIPTAAAMAAPIATTPLAPAAAARTASKVRWGRIVLSLAGATMIALAAWTTVSAQGGAPIADVKSDAAAKLTPLESSDPTAATVSGPGTDLDRSLQGNPNAGLPTDTTSVPASVDTSSGGSTPPQKVVVPSSDPVAAPTAAPMKDTSPSTEAGGGTPPMKSEAPSDPVVTGGGGPAAPEAAPSEPTTVPATAQRTAPVRGGGGPAAELPYTGAETWIVAILGTLVLVLGVLIQINAVRIGMTAMLYRRGILLRPVDCARLAGERGLAPVRVWISNALHYLLQEPAGADFVTSR